MGITRVEEAPQPGSAPVADPLVGRGQEPAYPIQRVSFGPCAETWVGWGEILGMGVRPRWNR